MVTIERFIYKFFNIHTMGINYNRLTPEQLDNINHARKIYCIDDIANKRIKKKADKFVCKAVLYDNNNRDLLSKLFVDYYIEELEPEIRKDVVNYMYKNIIFNKKRNKNLEILLTIFAGRIDPGLSNAEKIKIVERTFNMVVANYNATDIYNGKKLEDIKVSDRTIEEASKDLHAKGLERWQVIIALNKVFPAQAVVRWLSKGRGR